MFEIVKVKLIQCAFKVKKKYLDVSRLQPLYHQRMIELKTKGNKILTKNKIDHSTVFSTFDMDKLRKSVDTTGKSALILGKLPSLKVIRLKRAKRELHKASKIYKRLYRGGVGIFTIQTSWRSYIFVTHWFQQIAFKLGSFTNFKALFSVVSTDYS